MAVLSPKTGLLPLLAALLLGACDRRQEDFFLDNLLAMERPQSRPGEPDSGRVEELKREIRKYRAVVERKVQAAQQLGVYHKMLAVAYMRLEMYQQAYESLKEAMSYHTNNAVLFFYAGACAAQVSRAQVTGEKGLWLDRAEQHYRRAIELDGAYAEPLYGLAVLCTFELGRLAEAERLARRVLELRTRHEQASFLLANVLYRQGRLAEAAALYGQIAESAQVESSRKEALANKSRIEKELRGAP